MGKEEFKKRVNVCFGKNDLRCVAGKELDEEVAYRTARAVVAFLKCKKFIVGHDMRVSSHKLRDAFIRGILDSGADAIDIGEVDTPQVYFASGYLKLPGIMITASHNPAKYNGIKLVNKGASVIGRENGLLEIQQLVINSDFKKFKDKGERVRQNLSTEYRNYVQSYLPEKLKKMKVVIDAGNGMAGKMVPIVYKGLPVKIIGLDFKPDGSFPTHLANPVIYKNLNDLQLRVRKEKVDFGLAFDADMDRVMFIDEHGRIVDSSVIAALIIKYLNKSKRVTIVYSVPVGKIVAETARKYGGRAIREKVGHAYIKSRMRREKAYFGCEQSSHYYYKNNWFADSGLITSIIVCLIYSWYGGKFSDMVKEFQKYARGEEVSVKVKDKKKVLGLLEKKYRGALKVNRLDGLTLEFKDFWFNVRPSNTESLLRVNLEAKSAKIRERELKELLEFII